MKPRIENGYREEDIDRFATAIKRASVRAIDYSQLMTNPQEDLGIGFDPKG